MEKIVNTNLTLPAVLIILLCAEFRHTDMVNGSNYFCKRRLDELCESLSQAESCHTVPYCIHCKWNTAIIPTTDKCQICQDEITEGRQNETDSFYIFEHACELHGRKEDVEKCIQLVHYLNQTLIHDFQSH
ncbi:uncharacterized protein LOC118435518 [Folsomia candida]|uniref:uncharacterized protein LOC118435518 n=1 Tax=Folsomia candida TaxID=158441 RepID=UPI001604B1AB|nr:uncharacterized protein LOC118435518 [Folsomia candida]